jgi:hypothetical protein
MFSIKISGASVCSHEQMTHTYLHKHQNAFNYKGNLLINQKMLEYYLSNMSFNKNEVVNFAQINYYGARS